MKTFNLFKLLLQHNKNVIVITNQNEYRGDIEGIDMEQGFLILVRNNQMHIINISQIESIVDIRRN